MALHSFHEMGFYDLPAAIDYILAVTGFPSLTYVGFSMGTSMFWVLADSWGPKYMDRVDTMVAIAPIARPSGMSILSASQQYKALKAMIVSVTFVPIMFWLPSNLFKSKLIL